MPKSWDCFDTLVFRAQGEPRSVWRQVGQALNEPRFLSARIEADCRTQTLEAAYRTVAIALGWSVAQMESAMALEIEAEVDNCHPIAENLRRVQDGDLIISDFYAPAFVVERILRKCGLDKAVQFIVTPDGKHNGWIWGKLPYKPDVHIGDNPHSDGKMASDAGIPSLLYNGSSYTDDSLELLARFIKLQCPYDHPEQRSLFFEQADLNLPALALFAQELPDKPLALTFRDCRHLLPIIKATRPELDVVGFEASRRLYAEANPFYVEYVRRTTAGRVIVDLQGSGNSVRQFWQRNGWDEPELFYLCSPSAPSPVPHGWDGIERFNAGIVGSPIAWHHDGPARAPLEYPEQHVAVQDHAVRLGCEALRRWFQVKPDRDRLINLCEQMERSVTRSLMPHIQNH